MCGLVFDAPEKAPVHTRRLQKDSIHTNHLVKKSMATVYVLITKKERQPSLPRD